MMRQSPSPYMPQEAPPDVPALTKMVNMQASDDTMIKTEVPDVPNLIQADANSNYQHQQAAHQASPSPQSQNQGQSAQDEAGSSPDRSYLPQPSVADDVKGFLEKQKLEIYFDAFVQNGYDDIDDIIMMSDQRVEMLMNLTGIAKKDGHKGRFLAGILLMRTMKATGLAANRIMRPSSEGSTTPHSNDGNRWPPTTIPPHPSMMVPTQPYAIHHPPQPHPTPSQHHYPHPPSHQPPQGPHLPQGPLPTHGPHYPPHGPHPSQGSTPHLQHPPGHANPPTNLDYAHLWMQQNPLKQPGDPVIKTEDDVDGEGEEDDDHVKRPMNAFMVWSRTERRKLALKYPNMLNCEISKLLGAEWSRMNEEEKSPYVQESKRLRTIHSQKYPDYSYKPRRRKRKVTQSQSVYPSINFPPGNNSMPPYQFPPSAYPKMPSDAFKMPGFGSDNSYQVPLQDPNKALNYLNNAAMGLPTDMKSYYNLTPPTSQLFPPSTSNYSSLTFSNNSQNNMYSSASNYMPSLFKDHQF